MYFYPLLLSTPFVSSKSSQGYFFVAWDIARVRLQKGSLNVDFLSIKTWDFPSITFHSSTTTQKVHLSRKYNTENCPCLVWCLLCSTKGLTFADHEGITFRPLPDGPQGGAKNKGPELRYIFQIKGKSTCLYPINKLMLLCLSHQALAKQ